MLNPRYLLRLQFCLRVSLTIALLTVVAAPSLPYLVWAQQSAPELTVVAGEDAFELSWTAVAGAERYALWAWASPDGWQRTGGNSLTNTSYSHFRFTPGRTYHYTMRAAHAGGVSGPWSDYAFATFKPPIATPALTSEAGEGKVALSVGRWRAQHAMNCGYGPTPTADKGSAE